MTDMTSAAIAVNSFLEELESLGFGPELTQKVVIAAAPVIISVVTTRESEV